MDNDIDNVTNNNRSGLIFIIIILFLAVFALGGYICYDKLLRNNDNDQVENNNVKEEKEDKTESNENTLVDNSANLDFDFDELSNTLHSAVDKDDITTFVSKCESNDSNPNEPPQTSHSNRVVSIDSIDIVINKLKSAQSLEKNITYSWFGCPPKSVTYYVSVNSTDLQTFHGQSVFSLNYADGDNILLVGYNDVGYAFHFNSSEEINNFIESLK